MKKKAPCPSAPHVPRPMPVDGPTPWVNPVVIVPKPNDEIGLCIDMRRPIRTVDEILQGMNGSKIFSKLDLKWGYHQLELSPKSREITTFATHAGLYRYKCLLFGVCSASEQYQHAVSNVLAGIDGAENISNDIVFHGADQESHDQSVHAVLGRLRVCSLTLNPEKCQYNMIRIVFMGMLLSDKGIGPTSERVKPVAEAREPQTTAELLSYSSRFLYYNFPPFLNHFGNSPKKMFPLSLELNNEHPSKH